MSVVTVFFHLWMFDVDLQCSLVLQVGPSIVVQLILTSGKLSREKIFTNFAILQPPVKVFSTKFSTCHIHYAIDQYHSAQVFYNYTSLLPIYENFLPRKFPAMRYTVELPSCLQWPPTMGKLEIMKGYP